MKPILENLSPGARRTLKLFAWFWAKQGAEGCWPKLAWLQIELHASERTVCRWTAELAAAGAIRKQRRGRTSNRYLQAQPVEAAQMPLPHPVENSCGNVENGNSDGNSKELVSINDLQRVKTQTEQGPENLPDENKTYGKTPGKNKTPDGEEKAAVERTLAAFAVAGCGVRLIERLFDIGKFYCVNGFQIAAELARALGEVERRPSLAPRSPGWFPVVLEARLKRQWDGARKMPVKAVVSAPERSPGAEWSGDFTRGLMDGLMGRTG